MKREREREGERERTRIVYPSRKKRNGRNVVKYAEDWMSEDALPDLMLKSGKSGEEKKLGNKILENESSQV